MQTPERQQSKLIEALTRFTRDAFLTSADLRDVRREVVRKQARATAIQLDVFANSTLHEEPELWQR